MRVAADQPDVVIMDIRMPPTFSDEGLRAAHQLKAEQPGLGILLLSGHVEVVTAARVFDEHSHGIGYLLKDRVASVQTLVDALSRVHRGELVLDEEVVERLFRRRKNVRLLEKLSDRERAVAAAHGGGPVQRGHRGADARRAQDRGERTRRRCSASSGCRRRAMTRTTGACSPCSPGCGPGRSSRMSEYQAGRAVVSRPRCWPASPLMAAYCLIAQWPLWTIRPSRPRRRRPAGHRLLLRDGRLRLRRARAPAHRRRPRRRGPGVAAELGQRVEGRAAAADRRAGGTAVRPARRVGAAALPGALGAALA